MTRRVRYLAIAVAAWLIYGLGTYLAVLPDVPPDGFGRMGVLKLIRTGTGLVVGLGLVASYRMLRKSGLRSASLGAAAAITLVVAGYLWLALYQGLTAGLRGPDFFPVELAALPRMGIDHVFVLLVWGGIALWWLQTEEDEEEDDPGGDAAKPATSARAATALRTAEDSDAGDPEVERLGSDDHVYLRLDDDMVLLRISDIQAILADGDYTTVVRRDAADGLSDRSMKTWESALPPRIFARIHRSVIVNLSGVERLEDRPNGGKLVHLVGGRRVRMSRRYEARLKETLG